ncbi:hypothetical protein ID866_4619 [Astraeus odoratus]|nr:hypothetical protein ID866_4619 [Astraeus odoratus]
MTKFNRKASEPYTLITPDTPLADLAEFLRDNVFALGELVRSSLLSTAVDVKNAVTDYERKFVLAVATSQDLDIFTSWYRSSYSSWSLLSYLSGGLQSQLGNASASVWSTIYYSLIMAVFYDEIPESLVEWIRKQHMFWVATAPLDVKGHINLSPKGGEDTFYVVNSKRVYYEDLSGSGVETIAHIRENGRVTILFHAFEGPPRILRLFGTGTVYEYGSPEYETLIPIETRKPGSRAAIVVDVYQASTVNTTRALHILLPRAHLTTFRIATFLFAITQSCGFAVPLYTFMAHRTQLHRLLDLKENADRAMALLVRDSFGAQRDDIPSNSLRAYWLRKNMKSLDGLPGLLTAPDAIARTIPHNNFDKNAPRPTLRLLGSADKDIHGFVGKDHGKALALGFFLGATTATILTRILCQTG